MTLRRAVAISLYFLISFAPHPLKAQEAQEMAADLERGKRIYRSVGYCGNCHGWPGDGRTGRLLQAPEAPSLRESELDTETLIEVVKCGIPGTAMPYHGRTAYLDGSCYGGMELSDFEQGTAPPLGKTFGDSDVFNVVAYLEAYVIGRKEPTIEECTEFFGNPNARACRKFK